MPETRRQARLSGLPSDSGHSRPAQDRPHPRSPTFVEGVLVSDRHPRTPSAADEEVRCSSATRPIRARAGRGSASPRPGTCTATLSGAVAPARKAESALSATEVVAPSTVQARRQLRRRGAGIPIAGRRRLSLNAAYRCGRGCSGRRSRRSSVVRHTTATRLDLGREEARDLPAHSGHSQTPVDTSSWEWAYVDLARSRM